MTLPTTLITAAITLLVAGGAQVAGAPEHGTATKRAAATVVVATPAAARDPRTQAAIAASGAQLRVPRSPTEQLSVTHLFAARHATIVGLGLDRRVAIDPVRARYPGSHIEALGAHPAPDELRTALAP